MKILILGGTGAMGKSIVEKLGARGDEVFVTSRSQHEDSGNIHYLTGNARNKEFLTKILGDNVFDAIVDFMKYSTAEFRDRIDLFLNHTNQYMYLSSSRVYSDSQNRITERDSRLLDTLDDEKYLASDEYAIAKARQEDVLFASGKNNYTIVRPYITYNSNRLQLGIYEKDLWLRRVLNHKKVVFTRDIAEKYTTLTYAGDVANQMLGLIGNKKAYGEVYQLGCNYELKWEQVLEIYKEALHECGYELDIVWRDSSRVLDQSVSLDQLRYDRLYNRRFDSSKVMETTGISEWTKPEEGLKKCIHEFIENNEKCQYILKQEAVMDGLTGDKPAFPQGISVKSKIKYYVGRYERIFHLKKLARKILRK